jgi:hypothetical protein
MTLEFSVLTFSVRESDVRLLAFLAGAAVGVWGICIPVACFALGVSLA